MILGHLASFTIVKVLADTKLGADTDDWVQTVTNILNTSEKVA